MARAEQAIYTPSELNREVKLHLEAGFPRIQLEAEISNLARPASGHLYFSLKDDKAQVRCAMFRSAASRMSIRAENGIKVLAGGRISLYEARGEYQFIVSDMQDAGVGLLQRNFEELKKKLESEGLFSSANKQELPPYPLRIGLITSPSGAAVRDLLNVLERRWPLARLRLYPVPVQGTEAVEKIPPAIEAANRHGWADVLILGRGGGSLEDLMAFNDETVARAAFASGIPLVSAVGHETDFSICDFVADMRAATPSAAAELTTPDQAVLKESFARSGRQILRRMSDRLQRDAQKLDHLAHRLQQRHPKNRLAEQARLLASAKESLERTMRRYLGDHSLKVENLSRRLATHQPGKMLAELHTRVFTVRKAMERIVQNGLKVRQDKLRYLARTLNAISPLETVARGYAVVTYPKSGEIITSTAQVGEGDGISAQLKDGTLECTVDAVFVSNRNSIPRDPRKT
jgi:exodeoxyribonuclease VII large subunit